MKRHDTHNVSKSEEDKYSYIFSSQSENNFTKNGYDNKNNGEKKENNIKDNNKRLSGNNERIFNFIKKNKFFMNE